MKLRKIEFVLCLIASSPSGCAFMVSKYEKPILPTALNYTENSKNIRLNAPATQWENYFTDPHLQSFITLALHNNQDLRLAAMRVEKARAANGIQRLDFKV